MSDALLDEALAALRDGCAMDGFEPPGDQDGSGAAPLADATLADATLADATLADATLARILESIAGEGALDEAFDALREDAPSPSDAAGLRDDEATLARIQRSIAYRSDDAVLEEALGALRHERVTAVREPAPRRLWAAAAALLLALGLGLPTAWAIYTGRISTWMGAAPDSAPRAQPSRARETSAPEAPGQALEPSLAPPSFAPPIGPIADAQNSLTTGDAPVTPSALAPSAAPRSAEGLPSPPRRMQAASRPAPTRTAPPRSVEPRSVEPPVTTDEQERFGEAHRAHFEGADPRTALVAWDAYLGRYPSGRYELEARYNRALTLVRLGRLDEARRALTPFADGSHGAYRRLESARLIDALDAQ